MPVTEIINCTCRHTKAAHVGKAMTCGLCRCQKFQAVPADPAAAAPVLTDQARKALDLLGAVPVFKSVSTEGLTRLAMSSKRRLFLTGGELMVQGDSSEFLYVIAKGQVRVERRMSALSEPIVLAHLGPGEVVGEMGVLDGKPRSATVVAEGDLETCELAAPALRETFRDHPQALVAVTRMINERMHNTDEMVEKTLEIALQQIERK